MRPQPHPLNQGTTNMTDRVQIPAYTDRWMMGDRYGEIVKITIRKGEDHSVIDQPDREVAHVKLDKSGKVQKFWLEDCTPV
jgi:hypothetical protein